MKAPPIATGIKILSRIQSTDFFNILELYKYIAVIIPIAAPWLANPLKPVNSKVGLNLNQALIKGEKVNIDAIITSVGSLRERVNVTLFDDNNKLIGSKIIKISGKESQENVRFQIKPNKIGKNYYLIKCSALSDEINIQNNQQRIMMHVMKDQYNIALITGAPNYNTRLIKKHLTKGRNNKIDHFVYTDNKTT